MRQMSGTSFRPVRRKRYWPPTFAAAKAADALDRHRLAALEPKVFPGCPLLEDEGEHAHADEVGAMDALEALGDHRAHAKQARTLRSPVAARPRAVFSAGEITSGTPSALYRIAAS